MTWRIRSVRKRILLLALVPLLSLFGLYVFTTSTTARNAINLARADTLKNATGQPTGTFEGRSRPSACSRCCTWPLPRRRTRPSSTRSSRQPITRRRRCTPPDVRRDDEQRVGTANAGHRHAAGRYQEPACLAGAGRRSHDQPVRCARRVQHARRRRQPGAESDHPPGNQRHARRQGLAFVRIGRVGDLLGQEDAILIGDMTTGSFPPCGPAAVRPARRCPQVPGRGDPAGPRPPYRGYYTRDVNTQASAGLTALENTVMSTPPRHLPAVPPLAWQQAVGTVTAGFSKAGLPVGQHDHRTGQQRRLVHVPAS